MDLAREDDHRGQRLPRSIDIFNDSNPFAIPWLYSLYAACLMVGCSNDLCYISYTYLKASLIKVVDVLFKNTIFYYGVLNKIKLLVNNLRILTFCTLIIIFAGIF
jgi:hypothetical protein